MNRSTLNRPLWRSGAFAAVLLGVAMLLLTSSISAQPRVGLQAPAFTVSDSHGKSHSLSDYRGKVVVLEWLNHDCPFIVKHYDSNNMQTLQRELRDKGIVWLSVVSSAPGTQGFLTPAQARAITKEKNSQASAVLLDPEGRVGRAYGARVTPHMYVIDANGILAYAGAIDDKPTTRQNDVSGARNFVRQAVEELLAGRTVSTATTQAYGCSVKYN